MTQNLALDKHLADFYLITVKHVLRELNVQVFITS